MAQPGITAMEQPKDAEAHGVQKSRRSPQPSQRCDIQVHGTSFRPPESRAILSPAIANLPRARSGRIPS